MGMTYEELSVYGRLRKIFRCGPVAMYQVSYHFFFHIYDDFVLNIQFALGTFFFYCSIYVLNGRGSSLHQRWLKK